MLDTVKLVSPALGEPEAEAIERACVLRSAVTVATGELVYSLTTGSLSGSWDSRVSVRVERESWDPDRWEPDWKERLRTIEGETFTAGSTKRRSAPYLVVEGSVHKALLGHNIYGGPVCVQAACRWFVADVAERLGLALPCGDEWEVQRVDWAEVYELGSWEACEEYVSGLNMAQFPRRKVVRYGAESLMSVGKTTALKFYHKGPEFHSHDRKRLSAWHDSDGLEALQRRANGILRVETSIKARKLQQDFEGKPRVKEVESAWLCEVHDREVTRLLREAQGEMEIVRTHREVSRRLSEVYDQRLANTLFGTWLQLSALGEAEVKKTMKKATWYWQRKRLVDAQVSWHGSDVIVRPSKSAVPAGFSPVRSDPRRLIEVDPTIREKLGIFGCQ